MNTNEYKMHLHNQLTDIGIILEIATGHIFYDPLFIRKRFNLELVIVRHGETYGNCGQSTNTGKIDHELVRLNIKDRTKRIFQGNVNKEINQLTEVGKHQAIYVADILRSTLLARGWVPDIIFHSPLTRAKATALPFVKKNNFKGRFFEHADITEMAFGAWENRRICDFDPTHSCHLFYQDQHALIKEIDSRGGEQVNAECFTEVLLRAARVLQKLEKDYLGKRILMFTHSMFGSACAILCGLGQKVENAAYLAFDGKRNNGTEYIMPFATPILLNFSL